MNAKRPSKTNERSSKTAHAIDANKSLKTAYANEEALENWTSEQCEQPTKNYVCELYKLFKTAYEKRPSKAVCVNKEAF